MSRACRAIALAALILPLFVASAADAKLHWRDCDGVPCTRLAVPLDRGGVHPGSVSLHVERVSARRGPARGLTVLLAGGPGQSATSAFEESFLVEAHERYARWSRLTPQNDVVVFDQRGAGRSGPLHCRDLAWANGIDPKLATAACGALLGRSRSHYTTSDSVDDLEAVRQALGAGKLTLIGVSYGTYVAQRYAIRYPQNVEKLVLDSVVDTTGVDPLYRDTFAATRRVLGRFCTKRCGFDRDPVADVQALVARLGRGPLRGAVVLASGRRRPAQLTRHGLLFAFGAGDLDPQQRRRFPRAVESALRGDSAPILRLQRRAGASAGDDTRDFSSAALAATLCEDVNFPYSRTTPVGARATLALAAVGGAGTVFAPFDVHTAAHNDTLRFCRTWPTAAAGPLIEQAPLPDVPTLLLAGGMDTRTPIETARRVASRLPRSTLVTVASAGHSLIGNSDCADDVLKRFMRGIERKVSCGGGGAVRALPRLPRYLRDVRPYPGIGGIQGRVATAVAMTLLDAGEGLVASLDEESLFEDFLDFDVRVAGLRGGWFRFALHLSNRGGGVFYDMRRLELVSDVRISGTLRYRARGGATGALRVRTAGGPSGVLRPRGEALVGRLGGKRVRLDPERAPGAADVEAAQAGSALRRALRLRLQAAEERGHHRGVEVVLPLLGLK